MNRRKHILIEDLYCIWNNVFFNIPSSEMFWNDYLGVISLVRISIGGKIITLKYIYIHLLSEDIVLYSNLVPHSIHLAISVSFDLFQFKTNPHLVAQSNNKGRRRRLRKSRSSLDINGILLPKITTCVHFDVRFAPQSIAFFLRVITILKNNDVLIFQILYS